MKKLLFILTVLFFFACKKDDFHKESFSGIVLHTITKQPLINQEVILFVTTKTLGQKDPEFPSGRPIYTTKQYITRTDNKGNYTLTDFEVNGDWTFYVHLKTGEFIDKSFISFGFISSIWGRSAAFAREMYDTIYGEKPGIIRYNIKNINDTYDTDTLIISPQLSSNWLKIPSNDYTYWLIPDMNWRYYGKAIDVSRTDTFPAESNPLVPIKWLHKRFDTIIFKNENISILPNTITDYNIHY